MTTTAEHPEPSTASPEQPITTDMLSELGTNLDAAELAAQNGAEDPQLTEFLTGVAVNVKQEEVELPELAFSNADAHVPSKKVTRYSYVSSDENGVESEQIIDASLGKRLVAFRDAHSAGADEASPKKTTAEPDAQTDKAEPAAKRGVSRRRDNIADIVGHDKAGRVHHQSGVKIKDGKVVGKLNGKFMSKHELELIDEHQDQIREGMQKRAEGLKYHQQKKAQMIRQFGEEAYAERFADNPNVDPDAWMELQTHAEPKGAKHRLEDVQPVPDGEAEDFWAALPNEVKAQWESFDDDEKQRLREHVAGIDAGDTPEPAPADTDTPEPITDPSPKGLRARLKHIWAKAGAQFALLTTPGKEYFTDEEKGRKRRLIAGGVAGALAVATVASLILEARGHGVGHHPVADKKPPKGHAPGVSAHHVSRFQNVDLKPGSGDSLWHEEELHHPHASQHAIWERVQSDLRVNHLTDEEAKNISGVYKITK